MRYRNLSSYFREKYGRRLKKICIDGGFTCPNRDGAAGVGGCIFCGERGSGEHIDIGNSIEEQVKLGLSNSTEDDLFVAYFQNFTNTYAKTSVLKERYDAALFDKRIRVLAIGTRPDCIDEKIAKLIADYKQRVDVWVELGLQSADDEVARLINRGYKTEVYKRAVEILEKYGIPVVTHIIIGLPGEGVENIKRTIDYVADFGGFGVKLHSIYVMSGTRLAQLYESGDYTPPSIEEYVECVCYAVRRFSAETVFHRLTGDCPENMLIAPMWNKDKNALLAMIQAKLDELDIRQGELHTCR